MSRLLVLGNAGFDLLCPVPHLPRAGETLVAGTPVRSPGGKGLNQAVVAARAGASVHFVAPVGRDAAAADLAACLADEPVDAIEFLPQPAATDQSFLMVAPDGENCILSIGAASDALPPETAASIAARLRPGDLLLLQGNLGHAATLAAAAQASARGARVIFNPAPLRWACDAILPLCAVVVANAVEAQAITGQAGANAARALHIAGASCAIVTLGSEGCVAADATGMHHYPAAPARVVDTTGAGDTVCGVLAAALLAGVTPAIAIPTALRAAALTIQRPGAFAALPSVAELRALHR